MLIRFAVQKYAIMFKVIFKVLTELKSEKRRGFKWKCTGDGSLCALEFSHSPKIHTC